MNRIIQTLAFVAIICCHQLSLGNIYSTQKTYSTYDLELVLLDDTIKACSKYAFRRAVGVQIKNHSNRSINQIPIRLVVNQDTVTEVYSKTLVPQDSVNIYVSGLYAFDTAGLYTGRVYIDLTDDEASNNSDQLFFEIAWQPFARFTVDDVCEGSPSTFINTTQYAGTEDLKFIWRIGDTTYDSKNVSHVFDVPDDLKFREYNIELWAYTGELFRNGCYDTVHRKTTITSKRNSDFDHFVFDRELKVDPVEVDESLNYSWDLGDGNGSRIRIPQHTYETDENHLVCLSVSDNDLCISRTCKLSQPSLRVVGNIYADHDLNCRLDKHDMPLRATIYALGTSYSTTTRTDGSYELVLPAPASYTILAAFPFGSSHCDTGVFQISKGLENETYTYDVPYRLKSNPVDYEVNISNTSVVRGREVLTSVGITGNYHNLSQDSIDLVVTYDPRFRFFSSSIPGKLVQEGELHFRIPGVEPMQQYFISIVLRDQHRLLAFGDEVTFQAEITSDDFDQTNNIAKVVTDVLAPYDPNIKSAIPDGAIVQPVDEISYTIQFQNIGTSEAQDVVIYDRIENLLSAHDIEITGVSHPNYFSYRIDHNVLKFTFKGINLPQKSKSFEASQGFVSFIIKVKDRFTYGDTISNTATIYFDFEDGIQTNTTQLFLQKDNLGVDRIEPIQSNVRIYPNPVDDELTMVNSSVYAIEIQVSDLMGKSIEKLTLSSGEEKQLDTSHLPEGVYLIQCSDGGVHKLIKN